MKIIAVTNKKGGTGKTTTAHLLGLGLARKGYKVLFIDLDWQCHLSYMLNADLNSPNILDVIERKIKLTDAIQTLGNLTCQFDVIPSSAYLANNDLDWCFANENRPFIIKNFLAPIKQNYDYIIMDLDKEYDIVNLNALIASDSIIIPCENSTLSLLALPQLCNILDTVKEYNPSLTVDGILLTKFDHRAKQDDETVREFESMANTLDTKIYNTVIRNSTTIQESQAYGEDVYSYAPEAKVTQDYLNLVDEFLYEQEPQKQPSKIIDFYADDKFAANNYIHEVIQRKPYVPEGYKIQRLETKSERVQIVLTPTLKRLGKEQAESLGMSFNEYISSLIEKDLGLFY